MQIMYLWNEIWLPHVYKTVTMEAIPNSKKPFLKKNKQKNKRNCPHQGQKERQYKVQQLDTVEGEDTSPQRKGLAVKQQHY